METPNRPTSGTSKTQNSSPAHDTVKIAHYPHAWCPLCFQPWHHSYVFKVGWTPQYQACISSGCCRNSHVLYHQSTIWNHILSAKASPTQLRQPNTCMCTPFTPSLFQWKRGVRSVWWTPCQQCWIFSSTPPPKKHGFSRENSKEDCNLPELHQFSTKFPRRRHSVASNYNWEESLSSFFLSPLTLLLPLLHPTTTAISWKLDFTFQFSTFLKICGAVCMGRYICVDDV